MTLAWILLGVWMSPAFALIAWLLVRDRRARVAGSRALAEDIEVMRLEFAYALPSFEEGIHAAG